MTGKKFSAYVRTMIRFIAIGVVIFACSFVGRSQTSSPHKLVAKPATETPASEPVKAIGNKSAPIQMEVFSDYECPSCRGFYEQSLRPLISDYVASGKVYLIHRDYPLSQHKYSWEAARWVNAAAEIGKYPEVEGVLYDNQDAWAADGNIEKYVATVLTPTELARVKKILEPCRPQVIGLRPASFGGDGSGTCPVDAFIAHDYQLGQQVPVQATPTYVFTVKGQRFPAGSGVVAWPLLKQFFTQVLKG